jgi:hypothetical protein
MEAEGVIGRNRGAVATVWLGNQAMESIFNLVIFIFD